MCLPGYVGEKNAHEFHSDVQEGDVPLWCLYWKTVHKEVS